MNFQLDPVVLSEMTQKARQCFLDGDAPEYMQIFEKSLHQPHSRVDFKSLLRAAHSIKGCAGLAQFPGVQELAHKLEDLLQAIQEKQVQNLESAWLLFERGVWEMDFLLTQVRTFPEAIADPNFFKALQAFEQSEPVADEPSQANASENSLVFKILKQDLEDCFVGIEEIAADDPIDIIIESLEIFFEECLVLGETLNLPWLIESIKSLEEIFKESSPDETLVATKDAIVHLREAREQYFKTESTPASVSFPANLPSIALSENETESVLEEEEPATPQLWVPLKWEEEEKPATPQSWVPLKREEEEKPATPQSWVPLKREEEEKPATPQLWIPLKRSENETESSLEEEEEPANSQLWVPLKRLEGMTNNVEELILAQERLRLQQQLLQQANKRFCLLGRQFETLRQQVQTFWEGLDLAPSNPSSSSIAPLELDRFSELNSSLQVFQELMLQVQENRADFNSIEGELSEELDEVQKNLITLYNDVTKSRLVPFQGLAQRFVHQIQSLNRRYDKSVSLAIEGEDLLLDQLLLEELQTPLTHLLNNAFDHGIEPNKERLDNNKPATARIILKASTDNNQLVVTIADDGRGIDLHRVYQRALERQLCPAEKSFAQLSKQEIIDYIFEPRFSTADKVSELSGRGVGLDIVRSQIQKLRGTILVETEAGKGTTFTLKLPLSLSLVSLLLFQWQNHLLAVPTASVRETLLYSELDWVDKTSPTIRWQQKTIPLVSLSSLLAYPMESIQLTKPMVAIVLDGYFGEFAIVVDALVSERKLIVKPFDDTVATPLYLAGCTILGSGEVVPVILPQALEVSSIQSQSLPWGAQAIATPTRRPTIMVVEDSVATMRLLEKFFIEIGFNVVLCRDGQQALDEIYYHGKLVDLIISDIEMPRVNGFELLQTLQSDPSWNKVPIVIATSRIGERHRQQAMKLGANAYLTKPIELQNLLVIIQSLLKI